MNHAQYLGALQLLLAFTAPASSEPKIGADNEVILQLNEDQIRAGGIETQPIAHESSLGELVVPGVVTVPPQQLRVVAAPAAGLVDTLLVVPDEEVKEGARIATLKSWDLIEAQRTFLHALSAANLAAEKLRRDEQLFKEHIIAERRLIVTRAEAIQAHSALEERKQILSLVGMSDDDVASLQRERTLASSLQVRAPISGTVLQRHGKTGERVQAAAPLFTIACLDPIWVNLQIPIIRAAALESVDRVHLPIAGFDGKLIRVGRSVDTATQSVNAVAEFHPGRRLLRPGQAVQAILHINDNSGVQWRVPAAAVVSHGNRNLVFVRTGNGFVARAVTVVSETPQFASVQGLLESEERVATGGLLTLLAELAAVEK